MRQTQRTVREGRARNGTATRMSSDAPKVAFRFLWHVGWQCRWALLLERDAYASGWNKAEAVNGDPCGVPAGGHGIAFDCREFASASGRCIRRAQSRTEAREAVLRVVGRSAENRRPYHVKVTGDRRCPPPGPGREGGAHRARAARKPVAPRPRRLARTRHQARRLPG